MKGLFLVNHLLDQTSGVYRKIKAQQDALARVLGMDVSLCFIQNRQGETVRCVDEMIIDTFNPLFPIQVTSMFQYAALTDYIERQNVSFLYIRYTQFASPGFIHFLRQLKTLNVRVVLEVPTYPYDQELKGAGIARQIRGRIEKFYRDAIGQYVSEIVSFTEHENIFGKRPICIANAAPSLSDSDLTLLLAAQKTANRLDILCLAKFAWWHGYDRILSSLAKANTPSEYHLHFVGDGPALPKLRAQVEANDLSEHVTFYGNQSGEDLKRIIVKCHLGVDSLGRHRSANLTNSSLKSKEYLTFGLPLVLAHQDPSMEDFAPYIYQIADSDEAFSLDEIRDWFKRSDFCAEQLARSAQAIFNWEYQFKRFL